MQNKRKIWLQKMKQIQIIDKNLLKNDEKIQKLKAGKSLDFKGKTYILCNCREKNEFFLKIFLKTIAISKYMVYNKYIKVVKSGVTVVESGAKGGLKDALRKI